MNKLVKKVVIPVAGLGTRSLPFTKEVPKELLPVIDTPIIQFIVEEVISAGIDQIIFVTGRGKSALEDYFDSSPHLENWLRNRGKQTLADRIQKIGALCEIISVRQKEPLGLGHAVLCAKNAVGNERFGVCLGDEIFPPWTEAKHRPPLATLVEASTDLNASIVGVVEIATEDSPSYGMIDTGGVPIKLGPVRVRAAVEKPNPEQAPSPYAIIGRYLFEPSLFDILHECRPGMGGEIQLTDAIHELAMRGSLYAQKIEGARYDIGNHFMYVKAQIDAALRRPDLKARLIPYLRSVF